MNAIITGRWTMGTGIGWVGGGLARSNMPFSRSVRWDTSYHADSTVIVTLVFYVYVGGIELSE